MRELEKVCLTPFDDRDVRLLLVALRPYISDVHTRQIVHFFAHPEGMGMGTLYESLEGNWFTWKHLRWRLEKQLDEKLRRMPKADFNFTLRALAERVTDTEWHRWVKGATRAEGLALLKDGYRESGNHYRLKDVRRISLAEATFQAVHAAMEVRMPLTQQALVQNLAAAVSSAGVANGDMWGRLLLRVSNQVALCVLANVGGASFRFADGTSATVELGVRDGLLSATAGFVDPINTKIGFAVPILDTDCRLSDWTDVPPGSIDNVSWPQASFVARRNGEGKLQLLPTDDEFAAVERRVALIKSACERGTGLEDALGQDVLAGAPKT